jgi:TRAP-type transport system periplasmic protein
MSARLKKILGRPTMKFTRRRLLFAAGSALAAPAILRPKAARAADVTLRLHHMLPPGSNPHRRLLTPWVERVQAAANGKLEVRIFPGMQLGGAPPQLYDQARDGVVDIVWTLPGYNAGRFPRLEAMELPFVANARAMPNALATQEFVTQHAMADFNEVHPICVWAHDGGVIHARREVKRMDDLKGLKLRFPTRLAGRALEALGASPIGMPVPQVPESLAQGVIDGAVVPWEVVPSIRVHELVKNHTEIPGSPTFYTATFVLAMNKASYARLPADIKAAIDANSGLAAARLAGSAWHEGSAEARVLASQRGNSIVSIDIEEKVRWQRACHSVIDTWIAEAKAKNIDGGALVEAVQSLIKKHENA